MRLKFLYIIVSLSVLGACAYKKLDANLHHLEGRKIDTAINYLGVPDDKFTVDARDVVYVWGQNKQYREDPIRPFGGYSSNGGLFGGVGIVFGRVGDPSYTHRCTVKALTDQTGKIEKMEYQANAGGCERFTNAMAALERDYGVVE